MVGHHVPVEHRPDAAGESLAASRESRSVAAAMDAFTDRVDYPLMVVTVVADDGETSGCLAGFVSQCSIQPPRFGVCVSKVNHTYFVSERSRWLALHLLGRDQVELASLFGETSGDTTDKFGACDWHPGSTGVPVLDHCAAWLEGEILSRSSVGDHELLVVRPMSGGGGDREGLLTHKSQPGLHAAHPAVP